MPNRTASSARAARAADAPPPPTLRDLADALFRAACESCRQHARYACVVRHDTLGLEQLAAADAVSLADELLEVIADKYERAAGELPHGVDDDWWHPANMLWLSSREWLRHRDAGDVMTRTMPRHSADDLEALAVEFALQGSALLALRQATDAYRRARPAADLLGAPAVA